MGNFLESVAFAALMTLRDELKHDGKDRTAGLPQNGTVRELPNCSQITNKDQSNGYTRLCRIAKSLFQAADAACDTVTDTDPSEIVPAMLCGVFYKAIKASSITLSEKIPVYDYAVNYCLNATDFTGDMLFIAGTNPLADAVVQLSDMGFSMILTAANKSGRDADGIGFISAFAELVNYAEESVNSKFPHFSFEIKPAMIVVDKAIALLKEQMYAMEAENPSLKSLPIQESTKDKLTSLLSDARSYCVRSNYDVAAQKFREVLAIDSQNWEAIFFSDFCSVAVKSPDDTRPASIPNNTKTIIRAAEIAIPLSKSQLYTRIDRLNGMGSIAEAVVKQAEHYFVATMNLHKRFPNGANSEREKITRVNAIIDMLFTVGDAFEQQYSDDHDICIATAFACWNIGITCYESCNMPQPAGAYTHWMKMRRYDPTCRCEKNITPDGNDGYVSKNQAETGGCYIATCVYGSYDCPQVWTLRRFRDGTLSKNILGRLFVRVYYATSPSIVHIFGRTVWFRKLCKKPLDSFVSKLQAKGVQSIPYED